MNFVVFFFTDLINAISGYLFILAREGVNVLSNRDILWITVRNNLDFLNPNMIFGYGMYGQAASGISYKYAYIFGGWVTSHPEYFSMHNFVLQNLVDLGYLGVIILFLIIFMAGKNFPKLHTNSDKSLYLYLLIFIMLSGLNDLSINFYNSFVFICSIMIFIMTDARNRRTSYKSRDDRHYRENFICNSR